MDYAEALAVLDLKPGATAAEIEAAYKAAVRAWHPDRFSSADMKSTAESRLKRLNEAYAVLSSGDAEPPGQESAEYVDGEVRYLGTDPRLVGTIASGCAAAVRLSPDGIELLLFAVADQPLRVNYPRGELQTIRAGEKECRIVAKDPLGIVPPFEVVIVCRNPYFAKLLAKRAAEILGIVEPVEKPVAKGKRPGASTDAESSFVTGVVFAIGFMLVLVWGFALLVSQRPSPVTSAASSLPPLAVTKGSFSVWTEPAVPVQNKPYSIVVRITFPAADASGATGYDVSNDLKVVVVGSDRFRKDTTFRGEPPVPVSNGTAEVRVLIPGAAKNVLDTVTVTSKMLDESRTIEMGLVAAG